MKNKGGKKTLFTKLLVLLTCGFRYFSEGTSEKSLRNGMLFVLAWVAWVAYLRGWDEWRACLAIVLAWVAWVACLRGWHAGTGVVGGVLAWVAC